MCVTVVCQARRRGAVARRAFLQSRRRRDVPASSSRDGDGGGVRAKQRAEARAARRGARARGRIARRPSCRRRGAALRVDAAPLICETSATPRDSPRRFSTEEGPTRRRERRLRREAIGGRRRRLVGRRARRRVERRSRASRRARAIAAAATLDGVASVRVRADSSSRRSTRERDGGDDDSGAKTRRGWRRRDVLR